MNILGLDLGVGSIGWALIKVEEPFIPTEILGMGSRIISLSPDENKNFSRGKGETICAQRTATRTARKMLDRYQARRSELYDYLLKLDMIDEHHYSGRSPLYIWELRANAASPDKKLSLKEIGNVLRHLNQKRGYRHSKSDTSDAKETQYVQGVNARWKELQELGETPGQHAARLLKESEIITPSGKRVYAYRIKDNKDRVLPRQAYEAEFDKIMECQSPHWPEVLTEDNIKRLKSIIFYQRPLKSCKHLVNKCEFESQTFVTKDGREVQGGPKVAPRTSPLAQICRIYEAVNNIRLENPANKRFAKKNGLITEYGSQEKMSRDLRLLQPYYYPTKEERAKLVAFLRHNEKMSEKNLLDLLGLKKADGFKLDKYAGKGIAGDETYIALKKALVGYPEADDLLSMDYKLEDTGEIDQDTGEVVQIVSNDYMDQPQYKLWHLVYSSATREELAKNLKNKYGLTDETIVDALFSIDFAKKGFANKSAKFMRKLLPHLMQGAQYSDAALAVGVNHSDSLTKEENLKRKLIDSIPALKKGELRQPVVEKILNQMINVVNAVIQKWGRPDEIRIELARELKQNKENRAEASAALLKRESENKKIAELIAEKGLRPSRRNIQKYRLYEETGHTCIYCGQPVGLAEFLGGHGVEIEHIIPKSLLFDDSFSNRVCSCRACNDSKRQTTAYDFMLSQGEERLTAYINRVQALFASKIISRTKRNRLLCEGDKIPTDFLNRDLSQSQYIAKKAREILRNVSYNVNATSGSVTDFFRHTWGYDMVLHNLNVPQYSIGNLVEKVTFEHNGQLHSEMRIKEWTKRNDHRHHAIDALVIAQTRQGYIQKLNNLNAQSENMFSEIPDTSIYSGKRFHLLEKWAETRPHFSVSKVIDKVQEIAVSYKPGKKLTTPGKRYTFRGGKRVLSQSSLKVPRGALHQETIYGKIKLPDGPKKLKEAFMRPDLIIRPDLRAMVEDRIRLADNDPAKAISQLKKNPLIYGKENEEVKTIDCYREEYVCRKNVGDIELKNVDKIIDSAVRAAVLQRYEECSNKATAYKQSLQERPITIGNNPPRPVYTTRITTGLKDDKMVSVRKDAEKQTIGYAKSGNNHHVAFYLTPEGALESNVISFWTCIKRQKLGLPVIIVDPQQSADIITSLPSSPDVEEVAATMPLPDRQFLFSLQVNEMAIVGLTAEQIADARASGDLKTLSSHLYRVQRLSEGSYWMRLHTHTLADHNPTHNKMGMYLIIGNKSLISNNVTKVKVNHLGEIVFPNDQAINFCR